MADDTEVTAETKEEEVHPAAQAEGFRSGVGAADVAGEAAAAPVELKHEPLSVAHIAALLYGSIPNTKGAVKVAQEILDEAGVPKA